MNQLNTKSSSHTLFNDIFSIIVSKPIIILLFLTLIASGFRLFQLPNQPYWMDEGYTINAILSISETGKSVLDSGLPYNCPIYCYPTTWIADTFGHSATSYRLLSVLSGIALIPLFYLIGKKLFSTPIGLLTTIFLSNAYYQIAWSRQARWYTLFALFFWFALYSFYRSYYFQDKRYLFAFLTILSTVLAILTHGLGYLLPFIMISFVAIDRYLINKKFSLNHFTVLIGVTLACLLILEIFFGDHRLSRLLQDVKFYNLSFSYLNYYLTTYFIYLPLVSLGVYLTPKEKKVPIIFLSWVLVVYMVPLFFLTDIVHYRYLWHLTPIIFLLSALGVYRIMKLTNSQYLRAFIFVVIFVIHTSFGTGVLMHQSHYQLETHKTSVFERIFNQENTYIAYTPQPDWNSAYRHIELNKEPNDIIISSHPHFSKIFLGQAGYWLAYDYLGRDNVSKVVNGEREYYVNAVVINNLSELKEVIKNNSGFIIYDYMSIDSRIHPDIVEHIIFSTKPVFYHQTNPHSQVWVYRF